MHTDDDDDAGLQCHSPATLTELATWPSQSRCSKLITEATKNITMHPLGQLMNTVQIQTTAVHSRHNHVPNKDEEIQGMNITRNTIESYMDIPDCMTAEEN